MPKATLIQSMRTFFRDDVFWEIVIWSVPVPVRGSIHHFKYSMVLIANEECVLRYDNEAGKGDHRHYGPLETAYPFRGMEQLLADFETDVKGWLRDNPESQN